MRALSLSGAPRGSKSNCWATAQLWLQPATIKTRLWQHFFFIKISTIKLCYIKPGFVIDQTLKENYGRCRAPGGKHKALFAFPWCQSCHTQPARLAPGIWDATLPYCSTAVKQSTLDIFPSHLWARKHFKIRCLCVTCNPIWPISNQLQPRWKLWARWQLQ